MDVRRRRIALALAVPAVVVVGLLAHRVGGAASAFAADALYTVLVYLLVALAFPRARRIPVAAVAIGISVSIELLQLTGLPARLADGVPVSALVLGTGFQWLDLLAYLVGGAAAAAVDGLVGRRSGGSESRGALVLDPGERLGE
jgi:hypothetical protein